MCGEIDEENRFQADLHQRFLVHAHRLSMHAGVDTGGLNGYLDALFRDVLQRCVRDASDPSAPDAYARMAMQSVVLARLAGFLAGHVALNEDPMRKVLEAVMLGYAEADMPASHDHDQAHAHGHSHEH